MTTTSSISGCRPDVTRIATPGLFAATVSQGRWKLAHHLASLDRIVTRALCTPDSRLVITFPPRHGKSEYISRYLPAWYLGVWPDRRVLLTSYQERFASSWGRKARQLVEQHGAEWFGVKVAADSAAADRWDIAGREG